MCSLGGKIHSKQKTTGSPFIKKFQPIQMCLQGGEGRDATWNKCLLEAIVRKHKVME